ncbi:MAG: NAD(P)-dependent oxidoreductase [Candidatus Nanopelagicales bacterium]|nr:NAD(P)-dependent oxidoreductase [Candidatus Nanopelagicales bacterium]
MRFVVTGAAGFIGSSLVAALREQGQEVRGLDVAEADISADIGTPGSWQQLGPVDVVIHTAAMVGMPSQTEAFWRINTLGTRHVLDAAIGSGAQRFVLLSSVTVFGNDFPADVTEEHPTRPTGVPYADTKIAAEHLCLDTHIRSDIEVTVVRPGDVYGPRSRPWTLLPVEMIKSRRVAVPTTGIHSPVFVDDVVSGIIAAASSPAAAGQIITLSGGVGVPTGEYFDYYARMLGRRSVPRLPRSVMIAAAGAQSRAANALGRQIELSPAAVRYLADRRGTYSIAKARDLLGWTPQVGLDAGMELTRAWLGEQGWL